MIRCVEKEQIIFVQSTFKKRIKCQLLSRLEDFNLLGIMEAGAVVNEMKKHEIINSIKKCVFQTHILSFIRSL